MINENMYKLGNKRSSIRELFEYGKLRAKELGEDSVFDFSLGNPSVPAPKEVNESIIKLTAESDSCALHGYTSAQGDASVRARVADNLNKRFGANFCADDVYMTCGAAAGLAISLRAILNDGDEVLLLAPYFPEYEVFVKAAGATPVTVPFDKDFQMDLNALENLLSDRTKAIIVNSPNNPCGVIYSQEALAKLAKILKEFEMRVGQTIYLIADEPYRELVYDGESTPFIPSLYDDAILCYSFSKSLSLPGERIGYLAVNPNCADARATYLAILGAGRALGYVCAPSLFQRVVANCLDARPDISAYDENRKLLFDALCEIGFECVRPKGAFYLFVKALGGDAKAFSDEAKKLGLLIVPGDDFAAQGWVRIAYCVKKDMIIRAIPAFKALFCKFSGE